MLDMGTARNRQAQRQGAIRAVIAAASSAAAGLLLWAGARDPQSDPKPSLVERTSAVYQTYPLETFMVEGDWKAGFPAGIARLLAQFREDWGPEARALKKKTIPHWSVQGTHDLGFLLLPALRDQTDPESQASLEAGAASLAARYDPAREAIKAWDYKPWGFPVIIDTMANLELLLMVGDRTGDAKMVGAARSHAETTWRVLVRPDGSTRHICDMDVFGSPVGKPGAGQGADDDSTWSRGQAWAFYGWVALAERTGSGKDLNRAKKLGAYIKAQTIESKIPPWDYSLPEDPKDESAGAINAAAFARLWKLTGDKAARNETIKILEALNQAASTNPRCGGTTWIRSWETTHLPPEASVVGDYYLLEAASILGRPTKPDPPTRGVGKIRTTQETHDGKLEMAGFFCLTGKSSGLTAAHIMRGTTNGTVTLNGETYRIAGWEPVPRHSKTATAAERDLAAVELDRAPPESLPRWAISENPPAKENFTILADNGGKLEWAEMAPLLLDGYLVGAMVPSRLHGLLRKAMLLAPTTGTELAVGASGGPWVQKGMLVAVTSRVSGRSGAINQTAFGTGTWKEPATQWKENPPLEVAWLLVALGALLGAKVLARRTKPGQRQNMKTTRNLNAILGATILLTCLNTSQGSNALVEAWVDQTIVYVEPTPVYSETTDGDGNRHTVLSGYTNTYEEQRNREIARVESESNAEAAAGTSARTELAENILASTNSSSTNSSTTGSGTTNGAATNNATTNSITTTNQAVQLGRGDKNGDGTLSDAEVDSLRKQRVCMRSTGYGTKLDANGDGTFGVNEATATRAGEIWDGDNDGAAAQEVESQKRALAREKLEKKEAACAAEIATANAAMNAAAANASAVIGNQ